MSLVEFLSGDRRSPLRKASTNWAIHLHRATTGRPYVKQVLIGLYIFIRATAGRPYVMQVLISL
ncbi:MAG: hypothetical protein R3Y53_04730 [Bacillota bacterium]